VVSGRSSRIYNDVDFLRNKRGQLSDLGRSTQVQTYTKVNVRARVKVHQPLPLTLKELQILDNSNGKTKIKIENKGRLYNLQYDEI